MSMSFIGSEVNKTKQKQNKTKTKHKQDRICVDISNRDTRTIAKINQIFLRILRKKRLKSQDRDTKICETFH